MKKSIILFVMILSMVCISCRQNSKAEKISQFVGKWQGLKIVVDSEECEALSDIPLNALYQIELCEDGSVIFSETSGELIDNDVTWNWREISDNTEIELYNSDDDTDVCTLDSDGLLCFSEEDIIIYLEKVSEFAPYVEIPEETTENATHEYTDSDPTAFIGEWQSIKISVRNKKQYLITDYSLEDIFRLTINSDNTAVVSGAEISGSENPVNYTWGMVSDTEIELFSDNGSIILLSLDNKGLLVYNNSDMTVSLQKI
ncbi:MAG: hypothetical protein K2J39_02120 [Ruminococcus sp.]|nr:hypothetical protein [Ruminococcus sp.]